MTKQTKQYFASKDMVIAACALMAEGQHAKAGAFLMKASRDPNFTTMVESMAEEQATAKAATASSKDDTMSALASIVEGMADGVNDIDSLLDDLDYEPGMNPREEPNDPDLEVPAAPGNGGVNTDVEGEEGPEQASTAAVMTEAAVRLQRAQANLRKLGGK
jgi:hypothetical protein